MKLTEVSLLRAWLAMTAILVVSFLVWNFAPILIPFAVVFVAVGLLTTGIRALARYAERHRTGD
jgi:hypothetical protein